MIAAAINFYKALNPNYGLPDNVTLAEVKKAMEKERFWPPFLTDAEIGEAWELVEIKSGAAKVKGEG